MPLNKALFASHHVVKEYLVLMRDDSLRVFLDEGGLRSIGSKTSCVVELTRRVLNRREGGWRVVKYVIVRVAGGDEAAVRLCNRLLEARLPSYRLRREYTRRAACCTLYPAEMAPDNTDLRYEYQRTGAALCHYGDVILKSPFEPTMVQPSDRCVWRNGDLDLRKGVVVTQRQQLHTYLNYQFLKSSKFGVAKSNSDDSHFDPKIPIRYIFDDYNKVPQHPKEKYVKVKPQGKKYDDYLMKKSEHIKTVNATNVIYEKEEDNSLKISNIQSSSIKNVSSEGNQPKESESNNLQNGSVKNISSESNQPKESESSNLKNSPVKNVSSESNQPKENESSNLKNSPVKNVSSESNQLKESESSNLQKISLKKVSSEGNQLKESESTNLQNISIKLVSSGKNPSEESQSSNIQNISIRNISSEGNQSKESEFSFQIKSISKTPISIQNSSRKDISLEEMKSTENDILEQCLKKLMQFIVDFVLENFGIKQLIEVFSKTEEMKSDLKVLSDIEPKKSSEDKKYNLTISDSSTEMKISLNTVKDIPRNTSEASLGKSIEKLKGPLPKKMFERNSPQSKETILSSNLSKNSKYIIEEKTQQSPTVLNSFTRSSKKSVLSSNLSKNKGTKNKLEEQSGKLPTKESMNDSTAQNMLLNTELYIENITLQIGFNIIDWWINVISEEFVESIFHSIKNKKESSNLDFVESYKNIYLAQEETIDQKHSFVEETEEHSVFIKSIYEINQGIVSEIYKTTNSDVLDINMKNLFGYGNDDDVINNVVEFDINQDISKTYLEIESDAIKWSIDQVFNDFFKGLLSESLDTTKSSSKSTKLESGDRNIQDENIRGHIIDKVKTEDIIERLSNQIIELMSSDIENLQKKESLKANLVEEEIRKSKVNDIDNTTFIDNKEKDETIKSDETKDPVYQEMITNILKPSEEVETFEQLPSFPQNKREENNLVNVEPEIIDSKGIPDERETTIITTDLEYVTEKTISSTNIGNDIINNITELLFKEIYNELQKLHLEKMYLTKPMKNPSARLLEENEFINNEHLENETKEVSKPSSVKLHITAVLGPPSQYSVQTNIIQRFPDTENENGRIGNERIKDIFISDNDGNSENTSELIYVNKYLQYVDKTSPGKVYYPLLIESQNTLKITPSTIMDENIFDKFDILESRDISHNDTSEFEKNFQIINVDLDNYIPSKNVDFDEYKEGRFRFQQVVNVDHHLDTNTITYLKDNSKYDQAQINKLSHKNSEIVEIEDSLEIMLDSIIAESPLKVEHQILLNKPNNILFPDSLYEAIQVTYFIQFQFAENNPDQLEKVSLIGEFVVPKTWCYTTAEECKVIDSETHNLDLKFISPFNIPTVIETFGDQNNVVSLQNETDEMNKFSDVLSSQLANMESNIVSNKNQSDEFYTTVSIDNDLDVNDMIHSSDIFEHPELSTVGDIISSMSNDLEEENNENLDNFSVERENVILLMKNDGTSSPNIIRLQKLNRSPGDSKTDNTKNTSTGINPNNQSNKPTDIVQSTNDNSNNHAIKSILQNNSNEKKYKTTTSRTTSFPRENDLILELLVSQRNTSRTAYFKHPVVKKTLLDLSKDVKSKRIEGRMDMVEEVSKNEIMDFDETNILQSFSIKEEVIPDVKHKDSTIASDDLLLSSLNSPKIESKTRSRSLSDKLKFVAKQVISKLNPLKKNMENEVRKYDTNSSNTLNQNYISLDLSSKSSIDSKLSKNSLARYWNIHKFDSIKRMKVKGHLLPQTTWG